jgi:hypothetical protein
MQVPFQQNLFAQTHLFSPQVCRAPDVEPYPENHYVNVEFSSKDNQVTKKKYEKTLEYFGIYTSAPAPGVK